MRIGVDARKYFDLGIGTYLQNLAALFDRTPDITPTYFASPEIASEIRRLHRGKVVENPSRKYSLRELVSVSRQANRENLDLFHTPHYTLPISLNAKRIVTIHDITHLRFPEYFSLLKRTYAYQMIRHACHAADAVLASSEYTRRDLVRLFPACEPKIKLVYLGVASTFTVNDDRASVEEFLRRNGLTQDYILYVGSLKPHKNVPVLMKAFAALRESAQLQLVLVGEEISDQPSLTALAGELGIEGRLHSLGRIADRELLTAYQGAQAVVLPSLYEGFGFTVLEAMACGTPVVASRAASIPEVVGDAGILFDPFSAEELREALEQLLHNDALRSALRAKGLRNVERFTFQHWAENTLNVYRHLLQ
jgi:glycosyltransferase involved in cell wall biosynthesis